MRLLLPGRINLRDLIKFGIFNRKKQTIKQLRLLCQLLTYNTEYIPNY